MALSPRNILIVKLSAIGDVIHALPVAGALKQHFPQARLTWVVEKPAYDLLTNNPHIDEIILFDKPKYKSLTGLAKHAPEFVNQLRQHSFDTAFDLQGLFKSAIIGYLSGASQRLVYCNTRELSHLLAKRVCGPHTGGHIVEQYLDVVRALGCHVGEAEWSINPTAEQQVSAQSIAQQAGFSIHEPYVLLAPGANWPNKRWPVQYFAQVADWLNQRNVKPVLIGGPGDEPLAKAIVAQAKLCPYSIVGQTSLKQLAYITSKAQAFIGGDTGPMHLAAALKTPVVALMGPTDAIRNGPYGQLENALPTERACHGCWKRSCPKEWDCLAGVNVQAVQAKLEILLSLRGTK